MATHVSCQEVGFDDCPYQARGTEGQVIGKMLAHIRQEHGVYLPENIRDQAEASIPEPERMIWARIKNAAAARHPGT